jgi:hypothetical protein
MKSTPALQALPLQRGIEAQVAKILLHPRPAKLYTLSLRKWDLLLSSSVTFGATSPEGGQVINTGDWEVAPTKKVGKENKILIKTSCTSY